MKLCPHSIEYRQAFEQLSSLTHNELVARVLQLEEQYQELLASKMRLRLEHKLIKHPVKEQWNGFYPFDGASI